MSQEIKQIAERIRGLREISGVSLETLAKEFNIPAEAYRQYESGETDIPVSFLYEIASKFNVELVTLLTGGNPKLHSYSVVRKGKGQGIERREHYKYENLAYNFVNKKVEPFLVTVEPEPENTPVHYNSHPGQELNYVVEGTLKVIINGCDIILNEGDTLYFDSSINHGMKALNNQTAKFLAIIL